MEHQAVLFALVSGLCLIILLLRKKQLLFKSIFSKNMTIELDKTDKKLGLITLFSFLYFMMALFKNIVI